MSTSMPSSSQQAIFKASDCVLSISIDLGYTTTSVVVRGSRPGYQGQPWPVYHVPDTAREPSKMSYEPNGETVFGVDVSTTVKHGILTEASVRHHPKSLFVDRYGPFAIDLYELDDNERPGGDDARQLLADIIEELVRRGRVQCKKLAYLSDRSGGDASFDTMPVQIHFAVPRGLLWDQHLCLLSVAQQLGYPMSLHWESDAAAEAFIQSKNNGRLTFSSLLQKGAIVCLWESVYRMMMLTLAS